MKTLLVRKINYIFLLIVLVGTNILFSCLDEYSIPTTNYSVTNSVDNGTTSDITSYSTKVIVVLNGSQNTDFVCGVCWGISKDPVIDTTNNAVFIKTKAGTYNFTINKLKPSTNYYIRTFTFDNNQNTIYGSNSIKITTKDASTESTVTDFDGNVYHTKVIGNQIWMVENLKTTKYRDGTIIPNISDATTWSGLTSGAYCYINNDNSTVNSFGLLYNWYAVNNSKNLAPTGWHVATNTDWNTLITSLGGKSVAGGKLKEAGFMNWLDPNTGATNESGFSGVASGFRSNDFWDHGYSASWWTSTEYSTVYSCFRQVHYDSLNIGYFDLWTKYIGLSVRCVKDVSATPTVPILTTTNASAITNISATSGGNISSDGGATVTAKGVCWNTSGNPTISLTTKTVDGNNTGSYSSNITGLSGGMNYYVRAYATNSAGTSYGAQVSFTTSLSRDCSYASKCRYKVV